MYVHICSSQKSIIKLREIYKTQVFSLDKFYLSFPIELQIRRNEYQINSQDLLMVLCHTHTYIHIHN